MAENQLDQIKAFTLIVADTGDFESMKEFEPRDATTNPSLILKAVGMDAYRPLFDGVVERFKGEPASDETIDKVVDHLLIAFGLEILKIVPGRVSTEVDASLSFDTEATVAKARQLIDLYAASGIARERILIKIASTWEGAEAARILQKEGIFCNMTLLFSLCQAIACAEAGATLISPFVGRILDWYKAKTGETYEAANDPGVLSVKEIYTYYKKFGYSTEVMGASFRNVGEILELAGCDLLTISPNLLAELKASSDPVEKKLDAAEAQKATLDRIPMDEKTFRWMLNEDAMATEKLSDGIRVFASDMRKLREIIREKLGA